MDLEEARRCIQAVYAKLIRENSPKAAGDLLAAVEVIAEDRAVQRMKPKPRKARASVSKRTSSPLKEGVQTMRKRGRPRKDKPLAAPLYSYFLYAKHHSGIGSTYIKTVHTNVKPSFDNGCWQDVTNKVWARWDTDKPLE